MRSRLESRVQDLYPQGFSMVHRVVLGIKGREIDFSGYVRVQHSGVARVVAFSDFGGTLFDIENSLAHGLTVHKMAPGLPGEEVAKAAGSLAGLLYLWRPQSRTRLVCGAEPGWRLVHGMAEERLVELGFAAPSEEPERWLEVVDGKPTWDVQVLERALLGSWKNPIPTRLLASRSRSGYTVDIAVVRIDPGVETASHSSVHDLWQVDQQP